MFAPVENTFLYFAYGSNLLKKRIVSNNPSAELLGCGRLDDHQLDFKYTDNWRSASATIVPAKNSHVWGAIWRIHNSDMEALDRHEGVNTNSYIVKDVNVVLSDGSTLICRTYQQAITPPPREQGDELPEERRPCITYLDCIIRGAFECDLPYNYIVELKKIPHNGQLASPEMIEKLSL